MKNLIIIVLIVLCSNFSLFAQEQVLFVQHIQKGKEKIIKEHKRIKVKTISGDKFKGKLKVINESHILIKNDTVAVADIIEIRRDPILTNLLFKGMLIYLGSSLVITGLIFDAFGALGSTGVILASIGAGTLGTVFLTPLIVPLRKTENNWQIKVLRLN